MSELKFIPSGSTLLDCILGGGYALGRISSIAGSHSTGKTQLAISASSGFIKTYPKGKVFYLDAEHAFDQDYATALKMPVEKVEFLEDLLTVEHAFAAVEEKANELEEGQPGLFIIDSLDALSSLAEMDKELTESGGYGDGKAKAFSRVFRKVTEIVAKKQMHLLMISQVRDNITAYGPKVIKSGGRAPAFYSSQSIMLTKKSSLEKTLNGQKHIIGVEIEAYCDKNKVGMPYKRAIFNIRFGQGIEDVQSCLEYLLAYEKIADLGDIFSVTDPKTKKVSTLSKVSNMVERLKKMEKSDQIEAVKAIRAKTKETYYGILEQLSADAVDFDAT